MKIVPLDNSNTRLTVGILCGIGNAFFLVVTGALVKATLDVHSPIEAFFYRSVGVLILSYFYLRYCGQIADLRSANIKHQSIRGVIGAFVMICAFTSYKYLPLAQAQLFFFMSPLFVALLSGPVLKERVGPYRLGAIGFGMIGVLMILKPGTIDHMTGLMAGLGVTLGYSILSLWLRHMGRTENANVTVFYFAVISCLIALPVMPFTFIMPSLEKAVLFVACGASAFMVQQTMTHAYAKAPAIVVSPLIYTNLLWAMMIDYLFWSDAPSMIMVCAAMMIFVSNLVIVWREYEQKRRRDF